MYCSMNCLDVAWISLVSRFFALFWKKKFDTAISTSSSTIRRKRNLCISLVW